MAWEPLPCPCDPSPRHSGRTDEGATHTEGRRLRPGSASTRTARGGRRRRLGKPWAHAAASSGSPASCRAHLRSPGGDGRRPHFAAAASALLRPRGLGDLAIPEAIGGLRSARRPSRTDPARPGTARSHARPCHQPPVGGRALGLPPALRSLELLERDLSELAGTRGRRAVLRALERARRGGRRLRARDAAAPDAGGPRVRRLPTRPRAARPGGARWDVAVGRVRRYGSGQNAAEDARDPVRVTGPGRTPRSRRRGGLGTRGSPCRPTGAPAPASPQQPRPCGSATSAS